MYATAPHTPSPPPSTTSPLPRQSDNDDDDTNALVAALEQCVRDALEYAMHHDAIFYAERLFDLCGDYRHLHTLAQCYVRGGDAATACRLLQSYYPFFDTDTTTTTTTTFAPAATAASPVHPLHHHHYYHHHRSGSSSGSGSSGSSGVSSMHYAAAAAASAVPATRRGLGATPHATRSHAALATSSSGGGIRHEQMATMDVEARWRCQYLLGVCCAQTSCYDEGSRVLSELLRISAALEQHYCTDTTTANNSNSSRRVLYSNKNDDDDDDDDDGGSDDDDDASHMPRCLRRTAEAHYWLGVCEQQRRQVQCATEHFRQAVCSNPLLISAYDAYAKTAWQHKQSCLHVYDTPVCAPSSTHIVARTATTATSRGARTASHMTTTTATTATTTTTASWRTAQARSEAGRHATTSSQAQHQSSSSSQTLSVMRRFLQPYARAMYLLYTYRCAEAQQWLREHLPVIVALAAPATTTTTTTRQRREQPQGDATCMSSAWQLSHLALAHFHGGDMRASADAFARLLRRAPWRLGDDALVYYSTALWQLRDEAALGSLAQRLIEAAPLSPITLCVTANLYSLIKETKEALVMLQRAVQVAPAMAYAHALRGYELLALEHVTDAAEAFYTALSMDHTLYVAHAGLGEVHAREGKLDYARRYYKQAVTINALPAILLRYAATYQRRGATPDDLANALQIYEVTLMRHRDHVPTRLARAEVLLRLGRVEEAQRDVLPLLQSSPHDALVYVTLARCLQCAGQTKHAIRYYNTAMTLDRQREPYIRGCLERLAATAHDSDDDSDNDDVHTHSDDNDDEEQEARVRHTTGVAGYTATP